MAKKTKKQKIIAEYRRKLKETQATKSDLSKVNGDWNSDKGKIDGGHTNYYLPPTNLLTNNQSPITPLSTKETDLAYIKSGLLRTLILTVLAIGAQFVLRYYLKM